MTVVDRRPARARCCASPSCRSTSRSPGGGLLKRKVGDVKAVEASASTSCPARPLGMVGESGCGKSTAGRTVMKLLDPTGGKIEFEGRDITNLTRKEMVPLRREMQMIFQDPYSSLNPRHTVGAIISAPFKVQGVKPARRRAGRGAGPDGAGRPEPRALQPLPQRVLRRPAAAHRHRPRASPCDRSSSSATSRCRRSTCRSRPRSSTCWRTCRTSSGWPTSSSRTTCRSSGTSPTGSRSCTSAGSWRSPTREQIYDGPLHPYTHALISAVPLPDPNAERGRERILLKGDLPSPINPPSGCVFRTRCPKAQDRCAEEIPLLRELAPGHSGACHFPGGRSDARHLALGQARGPARRSQPLDLQAAACSRRRPPAGSCA